MNINLQNFQKINSKKEFQSLLKNKEKIKNIYFNKNYILKYIGSKKGNSNFLLICPICKKEFERILPGLYKTKTGICYNCRHIYNKKYQFNNNDRIRKIWYLIKYRCENKRFKYYGGKGIKVCDEWKDPEHGFENFYKWSMENGYRDDLTIDRIDPNGNYEPNNCRWVNKSVQAINITKRYNNTSGFIGIVKNKNNKYSSILIYNKKRIFLGTYYKSPKEAAIMREEYIRKNNTEHTLNFPNLSNEEIFEEANKIRKKYNIPKNKYIHINSNPYKRIKILKKSYHIIIKDKSYYLNKTQFSLRDAIILSDYLVYKFNLNKRNLNTKIYKKFKIKLKDIINKGKKLEEIISKKKIIAKKFMNIIKRNNYYYIEISYSKKKYYKYFHYNISYSCISCLRDQMYYNITHNQDKNNYIYPNNIEIYKKNIFNSIFNIKLSMNMQKIINLPIFGITLKNVFNKLQNLNLNKKINKIQIKDIKILINVIDFNCEKSWIVISSIVFILRNQNLPISYFHPICFSKQILINYYNNEIEKITKISNIKQIN